MVAHLSDRVLLGAVLHDPSKYPAAIDTQGKKGDPGCRAKPSGGNSGRAKDLRRIWSLIHL
jgi:hypothetical protein